MDSPTDVVSRLHGQVPGILQQLGRLWQSLVYVHMDMLVTHSYKHHPADAPSPVKIYEQGLISGTENAGIWAGDAILDTLYATVTIPATLVAGEYLIRHELIAVHQANNPQCKPH